MTPERQMKFFYTFEDFFKARHEGRHNISRGIILEDTAYDALWLLCQHLRDYLGFDSGFRFRSIQKSTRGRFFAIHWENPKGTKEQNAYVQSAISYAQRMEYAVPPTKRWRQGEFIVDQDLGSVDPDVVPRSPLLPWTKVDRHWGEKEVFHQNTRYALIPNWIHHYEKGWKFQYILENTNQGKYKVFEAKYNGRHPITDDQWVGFGIEKIEESLLSPMEYANLLLSA